MTQVVGKVCVMEWKTKGYLHPSLRLAEAWLARHTSQVCEGWDVMTNRIMGHVVNPTVNLTAKESSRLQTLIDHR